MTARALQMVHDRDPKDVLLEQAGPFAEKLTPIGARVLVATYIRPRKLASGLELPDKYIQEDEYQGKVGLVIKMGALAFTEDEGHQWGNVVPKVGDWVLMNIGDTKRLSVGKNTCRFIEDVNVQAILTDPDAVY